MKTPVVNPRRPYMNGIYLESDRDYVENNLGLAVILLDREVKKSKKKVSKRSKRKG